MHKSQYNGLGSSVHASNRDSTVLHHLRPYWELMRLDRPVGTFLLLWPTLAALWLVSEGPPPIGILIAFTLGCFVMRAAGCVVNDIADRDLDPHVARTRTRPLADGRLNVVQALICLAILLAIGLAIVFTLNPITRWMALVGLLVAVVYPFMKRFTHLPQLGLGIAFSWGIPMASTAVTETISMEIWLLFWASFSWIVAYDTQYAMVDREDDVRIGIKSTAILLGKLDVYVIAALQLFVLAALLILALMANLNYPYLASVAIIGGLFGYQASLTRNRERDACFRAFRNNTVVGFFLFAGMALSFLTSSMPQ